MSSPQNVVESLYLDMTADGPINTAFGGSLGVPGRIYELLAKQNDVLPLLVFDLLDVTARRNFDATQSITYIWDVHFDIYVDRSVGTAAAAGAGTLEETLFDNLDDTELSPAPTGLDRGLLLFTRRGIRTIEEDAIRVSSDARIYGTVA